MTLKSSAVSWILVAILSLVIVYQFIGANKAEQRAAQFEAQAKDIDAQLQKFEAESKQRDALAESRYQASLAETASLRSILAKGSSKPVIAAIPSHSEPLSEALSHIPSQKPAQTACEPFIYKGEPLVIQQFQVSVCDQQPMVQAEAAVALQDEKALVDKLNVNLSELTAKEVLQEKDLAAYKVAEASWKKAAKKSRIKRVLGVAEKVGLFAAGVYLGHKF